MRTDRAAWRRPAKRGFSILELLVVLVILGVIMTVAGVETRRALRRNALSSTAQKIQMIATRAFLESPRRGAMVFLRIGNATAGGPTVIQLWLDDPNGDQVTNPPGTLVMPPWGTVDPAKDTLLEEHTLDLTVVSLSTTDSTQIATANWSSNSTDVTVERLLSCDTFGRTLNPATGLQVVATATLDLTLPEMAGALAPSSGFKAFQLRLTPAWTVQLVEIRS
jgi:prepilin-type N-terminal cleavage/methylation domain-containing protein